MASRLMPLSAPSHRLSGNGVLGDEVRYVLSEMKGSADVNTTAYQRARFVRDGLATQAAEAARGQAQEHDAGVAATKVPMNVTGPKADEMMKMQAQAVAEKVKFRQMWIEAEHDHPVLTAYRHGGDIEKVDLSDLNTGSPDDEMTAVLTHVLPKLGDLFEAWDKIYGDMSPLSIPTVVALTKTNMFIPKDSIRDGIANDMAKEANQLKWIILGAILLFSNTSPPASPGGFVCWKRRWPTTSTSLRFVLGRAAGSTWSRSWPGRRCQPRKPRSRTR